MIYVKITEVKKVADNRSKLLRTDFYNLNGEHIIKPPVDKPLWLIFFNTEYHFCQMEIENICHVKDYEQMNIWLISSESTQTLLDFSARMNLRTISGIYVYRDPNNSGYNTFGVTSSPTSFLYSSKGFLIEHYKGAIKPEIVLKDLDKFNL